MKIVKAYAGMAGLWQLALRPDNKEISEHSHLRRQSLDRDRP